MSPYRTSIDWGDGSARGTGLVLVNQNGGFEVISSGHTYAQQGTYTLSVNVVEGLGPAIGTSAATVQGNDGAPTLSQPIISGTAREGALLTASATAGESGDTLIYARYSSVDNYHSAIGSGGSYQLKETDEGFTIEVTAAPTPCSPT